MIKSMANCKKNVGCLNCYIHKYNSKKSVSSIEIVKIKVLCKQVKLANTNYKSNW